ncbi:type II secretion system F family protein [Arthrobacter sp. zg-Y40]|uniref:type II secretion system F family protein n=1 Tax=Arthrobacter sp. zg-Y40 TaxID=2886939 RepID=UPI001D144930|nr:type II secretion system F family protein [Arthrobacter sp. zg-Y40]MCC3278170.1 type II secretion system F family protein [Arthrobacter sp. zg-Y40]
MNGLAVFVLLAAAAVLLLAPGRGLPGIGPGPSAAQPNTEAGVSDPALMLDLVAAMLKAGQPLSSALAIVAEGVDASTARCLGRLLGASSLGAPWETAWQLACSEEAGPAGTGTEPVSAAFLALGPALRFTATTGAPSAAVIHSHADAMRRRRRAESKRRAATLGVRLVVPLGLCSLPAFVALTVVPLLLSLVPGWQ